MTRQPKVSNKRWLEIASGTKVYKVTATITDERVPHVVVEDEIGQSKTVRLGGADPEGMARRVFLQELLPMWPAHLRE